MVGDVKESEKQIGIARDAMFDEKNMVGIEVRPLAVTTHTASDNQNRPLATTHTDR